MGEALIAKEVEHIPSAKIKEIAKRNLQAIAEGNQRDFDFKVLRGNIPWA